MSLLCPKYKSGKHSKMSAVITITKNMWDVLMPFILVKIKLNEVEKAPRHSAKWHYAEKHKSRHLGEWLFCHSKQSYCAECHYYKCHFDKCHFPGCHYVESHYAKCHSDERHCA